MQGQRPVPVPRTAAFAVLSGSDTINTELVTWCADRIIGDIETKAPVAYVHYEADLGMDRRPTEVRLVVRRDSPDSRAVPFQVARHHVVGDTALLELVSQGQTQIQRNPFPARAVAYLPNYVGLFDQLVRTLTADQPTDSIPVYFLATGGHTKLARILRRSQDSVSLTIGDANYHVRWDQAEGTLGAELVGSKVRMVRLTTPEQSQANSRCAERGRRQDVGGTSRSF